MKKKTVKILLILGIVFIALSMIVSALLLYFLIMNSVLTSGNVSSLILYWFLFIIYILLSPILTPIGIVGIILVVIGLVKRKSSHKYQPHHPYSRKKLKNLPSWLKGGLIGLLVGLVLFVIHGYNLRYCKYGGKTGFICIILKPLEWITYPLIPISGLILKILGQTLFTISVPLIFLLQFILLGVLIALLIEKIRKK